jgi:asparagine synthetase B (glutamine-hydrolysing)
MAGRPKEYSTRGKDKSPFGRDVIGTKDLKYNSRNENFIDSIKKSITKGGSKIINEGKSMMDEQNILEN